MPSSVPPSGDATSSSTTGILVNDSHSPARYINRVDIEARHRAYFAGDPLNLNLKIRIGWIQSSLLLPSTHDTDLCAGVKHKSRLVDG